MKVASLFLILVSSLLYALPAESKSLIDIPVIGILTQPYEPDAKTSYPSEPTQEFIDAYYPQYLNAAGANVVPLSYNLSEPELRAKMSKLNGVFFTGGGISFILFNKTSEKYELTPYGKAAKNIYDIARDFNDKGSYFPIWGTCMGFQLLAFLLVIEPNIPKEGCDCVNYNAELMFTPEAATSRMFSTFTKQEMTTFIKHGLTLNSHHYFVDYLDFMKHPSLDKFYNVLAYSKDKKETLTFITAMEAKNYPFYGVQFHPEVRQFSLLNRIPGAECSRLAQKFANYFVNEARQSSHTMPREELLSTTLWNVPISQPSTAWFIYIIP